MPALALVPLRFFLGATFLYAGFDKLLDPSFLDATAPTSIFAQLSLFVRDSPLSPIITSVEPYAVPIGLLIACAEIGIGLGALTGLAFRVAATGGAILSILFWLTASWAVRPYYYGPDLPYAIGWITLALAGHGGILVPRQVREMGGATDALAATPRSGRPARPVARATPTSPERRALLQTGVLGVLSVLAASFAIPFGLAARSAPRTASRSTGPTGAAVSPSGVPRNSIKVATTADVDTKGSASFTIPFSAPTPLPAGDPGIIVKLKDGRYVAFDAVCTHEGCTVDWDTTQSVLLCPCHGAAFDAANDAAVLRGPTDQPLPALPLVIDQVTGDIYLTI